MKTPEQRKADFEAWVWGGVAAGRLSERAARKLLSHAQTPSAVPLIAAEDVEAKRAANSERQRRRILADAHIPRDFWQVCMEQTPLMTEEDRPFLVHDENRDAYLRMRNFVAKWEKRAKGVTLLSSDKGVGKSFLALAAGVYICRIHTPEDGRHTPVQYIKTERLLQLYRDSFGATWAKDGAGVMSTETVRQTYMIQPDVLILDDLGWEHIPTGERGDWARMRFFELMDYRYERKLTTLVTTNLDPQKLEARYGDAFTSRLLGRSPITRIGGPDFRQIEIEADEVLADPFEGM